MVDHNSIPDESIHLTTVSLFLKSESPSTVNTQAKRWPTTGSLEINNGDTKTIEGISYTFILVRSQSLTLSVNGTDKDSLSPDYALGTMSKSYLGAEDWGTGIHTEKPACSNPAGCYEITYVIEVKP